MKNAAKPYSGSGRCDIAMCVSLAGVCAVGVVCEGAPSLRECVCGVWWVRIPVRVCESLGGWRSYSGRRHWLRWRRLCGLRLPWARIASIGCSAHCDQLSSVPRVFNILQTSRRVQMPKKNCNKGAVLSGVVNQMRKWKGPKKRQTVAGGTLQHCQGVYTSAIREFCNTYIIFIIYLYVLKVDILSKY